MPVCKRILILQGHPDAEHAHFGHILASAYAEAARAAGHEVRTLTIARLQFPFLHRREDWDAPAPADIVDAQHLIAWAQHLVLIYPLWLGDMPAVVKAFLEQVLRPGFAFDALSPSKLPRKLLTGRSARIVVTMGMPGFFYRWYYRAHSLKSLELNMLRFVGIRPVYSTVVGSVESDAETRQAAIAEMARLGAESL